MKRILLIESDPSVIELVQSSLSGIGFQVIACSDANAGLVRLRERTLDLLILARTLPGSSGLEICKQVRLNSSLDYLPVVVVSATNHELDRIVCLEIGADAYITKPIAMRELTARVKTLLWRTDSRLTAEKPIEMGGLRIDPACHCVKKGNEVVPISANEFQLLHFLAIHPNHVFTRSQLVEVLRRGECSLSHKSVDVYIYRLREKLETNRQHPLFIKTLRGAGYILRI